MRSRQLLKAGFERFREILEAGTGFELVRLSSAPPSGDDIWCLRFARGRVRILVEAKHEIWPRDVERLVSRLREHSGDGQTDRCLIVAKSLTKRTRELLKGHGIDYIDLGGNALIAIPGRLLIVVEGDEEQASGPVSRRDRIVNPFQGKASRIVRALLAMPERRWRVTELANGVGVSAGLAVKTVNGLEDEAYIIRDEDRSLRLSDGVSLLRDWSNVATNAFQDALRLTSKVRDPDELTTVISDGLSRLGVQYAITRLAGARFIEPYAPANVVDVYVDGDPEEIASALELLPVSRGESVRFALEPDAGVFQFAQQQVGGVVVHPVQLFVDLVQGGGREPDVAEQLFEKHLRGVLSHEDKP